MIFGCSVTIRDCEIARNALDGVMIAESRDVIVEGCLAKGNGGAGIVACPVICSSVIVSVAQR